jgi:hypothetical protein
MKKQNFLLGKGERLTKDIQINRAGGPKLHPYTFEEAKERLDVMLTTVVESIEKLPSNACPDDLAIATITLNPEYIAKSYFPKELLKEAGLEPVGSRPKKIKPSKRSRNRESIDTVSTEIFVRGTRLQFQNWSKNFPLLDAKSKSAEQIREIEEISFPAPSSKIKNVTTKGENIVFEIVLHVDEKNAEDRFLGLFKKYLYSFKIEANFDRRFYAGGLCFVQLEASVDLAEEIAKFTLVRVVRAMPKLRLLPPVFRNGVLGNDIKVTLPETQSLDQKIKAAIFDGGIPADHPLVKWATPYEFPNMIDPDDDSLCHGVAVTSAFLFGHINPKVEIATPYCLVDHYRVFDSAPGQNPYELFEILERINNILTTKDYDFINLSLGPNLPIEDEEVHVWTAVLDEYLSSGTTLATIAVGNDGNGDPSIQANRIQVPADCVNALSIGACDIPDDYWQRADYSSVGPGRSPGLVKPDLVDFGGSSSRPFLTLDLAGYNILTPTAGTSFSSPAVLRMGCGVKAHFGNALNSLAIKTLLVHCCEATKIPVAEVGWGRVARTLDDIVLCDDHVMRVVYQGSITASKYIRVPIPLPSGNFEGMFKIKATICYATNVDPHHPDNYTRSGLDVIFRPNKNKFIDGAVHPVTKQFFSKSKKSTKPTTGEELRSDTWKWENCLHASNRFRGTTLVEPFFDIHYNARLEGHNDSSTQKIHYAIVITVEAPSITNLYDQVVRKYATQLEALKPVIDIPLRPTTNQ